MAGVASSLTVRVSASWTGLALRAANGAALSGGAVTVAEGESTPVTAVLLDDEGGVVDGPPVEWSASDPGVATYSGGGVRGMGAGETVLTARAGGLETTLRVTVAAPAVVAAQTPPQAPPTRTAPDPTPPVADRPAAQADPVAVGPGTLVIVVTPGWANAFLDGQPVGEYKTSYEIELEAGSYQIRLENPAFVPADTTLTIRPGQVTRWERRLGNGSDS
jgi:hypothetical protein